MEQAVCYEVVGNVAVMALVLLGTFPCVVLFRRVILLVSSLFRLPAVRRAKP